MRRNPHLLSACLLLAFLIAGLSGCLPPGKNGPFSPQQPTAFFVAPTLAEAPDPTTLAPAETTLEDPNLPTATVQCRDNLAFVKDITIPDGTVVAPDSTLDKRWEVENNGNCNWAQDYRIRLIAGAELGAQKEQALYPARSGSRAIVRLVFKAPLEPGTYRSAWQAFTPRGDPFGDPFFMEIKVEAP